MLHLLVIDDDRHILNLIATILKGEGLTLHACASGEDGLRQAALHPPDVALVDNRLPGMSGLEVYDRLHAADPHLPVILMSCWDPALTARAAYARGAFHFLNKPFTPAELRGLVRDALFYRQMWKAAGLEPDELVEEAADALVGTSAPMRRLYADLGRAARHCLPVLLRGESGTGKELAAQALHRDGQRRGGPFVAVNCAAIAESLLESELFGHEKGSFTGAERRHAGAFERADGGTLFLDEAGDLAPAAQAKMLRVLQDQSFHRVGGSQPVQVDVRLVAATNRDLEAFVRAGRFREDLYYRLNVLPIALPPLRERAGDVPLLVKHFLRLRARQTGERLRLLPEALALLRDYHWPGNVRELRNALLYAAVHAINGVVTPESLPPALRGGPAGATAAPDLSAYVEFLLQKPHGEGYRETMRALERAVLEAVLQRVGGCRAEAARLLGLPRSTLRDKLHVLGIEHWPTP
jgi:two-component system nitrogen regulation response regulator GlnG